MENSQPMPRTRLQAKKEQEEKEYQEMMQAAQTLMELSNQRPVYRRTLSIHPGPSERAMQLAETLKPGETIMLNFHVDQGNYATVAYLENQDGKIVRKRIEGPYEDFTMQWTYSVTDFAFYRPNRY
jgi:aspartate carbamoyltransferase catalytic subunit